MLNIILTALIMAGVWMMLTARLALDSFVVGFALSIGVLLVIRRQIDEPEPRTSGRRLIALITYMSKTAVQILVADIGMIRRVLAPDPEANDGIIEVPVGSDRESVAALSAHAITITPGSLVVDFKDDAQTMLVHTIDLNMTESLLEEQRVRYPLCERMLEDE